MPVLLGHSQDGSAMRAENDSRRCAHLGCLRDAQSRGFCGAHYMRQKRGTAMDRPVRTLRPRTLAEQLRDAGIAYAEAESAREFDNAWARLRAAAKAYTFLEAS